MPGFSWPFTSSRTTEPHLPTLLTQLRALDPTAGVAHQVGTAEYVVKKATTWTSPQRTAAQNTIDNAPEITPQLIAQDEIDRWPISMRAFAETLLDEINLLRAQLSLAPRTPAQVITAIRNKAGTLS